jgi:hypothetical protein
MHHCSSVYGDSPEKTHGYCFNQRLAIAKELEAKMETLLNTNTLQTNTQHRAQPLDDVSYCGLDGVYPMTARPYRSE